MTLRSVTQSLGTHFSHFHLSLTRPNEDDCLGAPRRLCERAFVNSSKRTAGHIIHQFGQYVYRLKDRAVLSQTEYLLPNDEIEQDRLGMPASQETAQSLNQGRSPTPPFPAIPR